MSATYFRPGVMLDVSAYDRAFALAPAEHEVLRPLLEHSWGGRSLETVLGELDVAKRLVRPIADALQAVGGDAFWKRRAMLALLRACVAEERAFWGWDIATWRRYLAPVAEPSRDQAVHDPAALPRWSTAARQHMIATAYVLGTMPEPSELRDVRWLGVAQKVFGEAAFRSVARVEHAIAGWGYARSRCRYMRGITAEALVRCGHPQLEHLARLDVAEWRRRESRDRRGLITLLSKALVQLGVAAEPVHAVEAGAPGRRRRRWPAGSERRCETPC